MTSTRCVQCGYTVPDRKLEEVWFNGERIPLHKGGCPQPSEDT
jgi:hypothetical protein